MTKLARQEDQSIAQTSPLLSPKEVAVRASYRSEVSVLRAFRRGELAGYKLNARTIRFHPDDVARWLEAARVGS